MKGFLTISLVFAFALIACSQGNDYDKPVGGSCDRCESMYEGMPKELSWKTTIASLLSPVYP